MKTFTFSLTFSIFLACISGFSQSLNQKQIRLESTDVFLVNVNVDTIFHNWHFKELGRNHKICKISVNKIYYMADTVYMTVTQLLRAKYMLYDDTKIIQNQSFDVSLVASDKPDIFIMSKTLKNEEISAKKFFHPAVITSIGIKCRKINKFLRLHLN